MGGAGGELPVAETEAEAETEPVCRTTETGAETEAECQIHNLNTNTISGCSPLS